MPGASKRHEAVHGARAAGVGVADAAPSAGAQDVGFAGVSNAALWSDVPVGYANVTVPPVAIVAGFDVAPATYHWWFAAVTSAAVKPALSGGASACAAAGAKADATSRSVSFTYLFLRRNADPPLGMLSKRPLRTVRRDR